MKLEVLVSCMHEPDDAIVGRSHITSDVLIVNQCDSEGEYQKFVGSRSIRKIDTKERGLSRSRNMAIRRAKGDICLLCDDDEVFEDGYEKTILKAFSRLPDADIVIFSISNQSCGLKRSVHKLNYLECLKVCSWQIAFRRKSILKTDVRFNPLMGAGSGNGCGEENKFLLDCYKKGLKIYYFPKNIASVMQTDSTWFHGYDEKFFYQRGIATRYMLGLPLSIMYAFYYAIRKKKIYADQISPIKAMKFMLSGIKNNDIRKEELRVNGLWKK